MAEHHARVHWRLQPGETFLKGQYSRGHTLSFDEGLSVPGSASPHVVGKRWSEARAADPEELLVAALSSCHMLTFLHHARRAGFVVVDYGDDAVGILEEVDPGRHAVTRVTLRPRITWEGGAPDAATLAQLHHDAHEECFIANSVRTEVTVDHGEGERTEVPEPTE